MRRNAGIEFESIPAIGCVAASVNVCVARPLRHIVNQALHVHIYAIVVSILMTYVHNVHTLQHHGEITMIA